MADLTPEQVTEAEHELVAADPAAVEPSRGRAILSAFSFRHVSLLYVGLALIGLFAIWAPSTFLTSTTAQLIAQQQVVTAIIAAGLIVPLAAGAFDLSVGYVVGLGAMFCAWLVGVHSVPVAVAIPLTLLVGLAVGAVNGFLVVIVGIDSLIATLASGSLCAAATLGISNNAQIIVTNHFLSSLGNEKVAGIPVAIGVVLVVAVLLWLTLDYTPWGRRVYAVGGSQEVSRLAGVRVRRVIFLALVVSGVCSALAGVMLTATLGAASPELGPSYLLPAFAAAFLGSTQINAGRFNVWGTVLAVYVLGIGIKGLQLVTDAVWVPYVFNGVVLATAVGLTVLANRHGNLLDWLRRGRRRAATARA